MGFYYWLSYIIKLDNLEMNKLWCELLFFRKQVYSLVSFVVNVELIVVYYFYKNIVCIEVNFMCCCI